MKTLPLAVLMLLASAGIAPAQTKSTGPLDLEYKQRGPALRRAARKSRGHDSVGRELDRQRNDAAAQCPPGPLGARSRPRRPTQGLIPRLGR